MLLAALLSLGAPEFFNGLYLDAESAFCALYQDSVNALLSRWELPDSCEPTVKKALFLHLILKADGPLGVYYLMRNTRHGPVFKRVNGRWVPLDSIWVKGHRISQRASDVDRIPRLFFADLFHNDTLDLYMFINWQDTVFFHTFGWCSELEMAYVVALSWFGIKARVVHCCREHVITGVSIGGREFLVDNSFDYFMENQYLEQKPYPPDLAKDKEVKRLSRWFNARALEGIKQSRNWQVGALARKRIRKAIGLGP